MDPSLRRVSGENHKWRLPRLFLVDIREPRQTPQSQVLMISMGEEPNTPTLSRLLLRSDRLMLIGLRSKVHLVCLLHSVLCGVDHDFTCHDRGGRLRAYLGTQVYKDL